MFSKIPVCYIVDHNNLFQKLLEYSIDTLLKFNVNYISKVIIIDIGMNQFERLIIENNVKKIIGNNSIELKFYNLDIHKADVFPYLPNVFNKRLGRTTLIRFFISELLEEDYVWYIDNDILFNGDIHEELLDVNKDILFKAFLRNSVKESELNDIVKKINLIGKSNTYQFIKLFNAGLMFINNKMFNDLKCLPMLCDFYEKYKKQIRFLNQDGYIYLFRKFYDRCILKFDFNINNSLIDSRVKAIHFTGSKSQNFFDIKKTYTQIMGDTFNLLTHDYDSLHKYDKYYTHIINSIKENRIAL